MEKREIKFRFWLGHTKKMTYAHTLQEVGKIIPEFTDDIIPLQYTGVKDKNGKEIYEGDILEYAHYLARKSTVGQVVWNDFSLCWSLRGLIDEDLFIYRQNGIVFEIVGNIYEHPRLIPQTAQ